MFIIFLDDSKHAFASTAQAAMANVPPDDLGDSFTFDRQ